MRSKFFRSRSFFSSRLIWCQHRISLINLHQVFRRLALEIINSRAKIRLSTIMFKMNIFNISKTPNRLSIWSQIFQMNNFCLNIVGLSYRRIFDKFYIFFRYVWFFSRNLSRLNKFEINMAIVLKVYMFTRFSLNKIVMWWWFFWLFFHFFYESIFSSR
jgi:hypothetical protein